MCLRACRAPASLELRKPTLRSPVPGEGLPLPYEPSLSQVGVHPPQCWLQVGFMMAFVGFMLAHVGIMLAHAGFMLGNAGFMLGQVGSVLAQVGSKLGQVGPKMASQGLCKVNLARFWPENCSFWNTQDLQNTSKKQWFYRSVCILRFFCFS